MVTNSFVHGLEQGVGSFLCMWGMSVACSIVGAVGGVDHEGNPGPPAPRACHGWKVRSEQEMEPGRLRREVEGQSAACDIEDEWAS